MMSKHREEAVWQRVMAATAQAPEITCGPTQPQQAALTPQQLTQLLEQELLDACTYQVLAARTKKNVRQCLLQLAREEQAHARKLETVCYLMTGKLPCPDRPKAPCVSCTNEELRRRYAAEVEGAARYAAMAEKAGSFGSLFRGLALEEEHHSRMILNMLERWL